LPITVNKVNMVGHRPTCDRNAVLVTLRWTYGMSNPSVCLWRACTLLGRV